MVGFDPMEGFGHMLGFFPMEISFPPANVLVPNWIVVGFVGYVTANGFLVWLVESRNIPLVMGPEATTLPTTFLEEIIGWPSKELGV